MCGDTACKNTVRGKQGDPGVSSYEYIAYASDSIGTGFSLIPSNSLKWINHLIRQSPATTLTAADFTGPWVKYLGDDGNPGIDGAYGGFTIPYKYRSNTSNSNPGAGNIRFNNTTASLVTEAYVSETDNDGTGAAAFLAILDSSTSTVKAYIKVYLQSDSASFSMYGVTGYVDNGAWVTLTLTYVNSYATTPFADQDQVLLSASITGNKGDTGAQGTTILYNNVTAVGSNGSGVANTLMTYTVPANTLTTNGSVVKSRMNAVNLNGNVLTGDGEYVSFVVKQGATSFALGYANIPLSYTDEAFYVDVLISRKSTTSVFLTATLTGNYGFNLAYFNTSNSWDWTLPFDIYIEATDVIVGGPQPAYIEANQLYVEKIIK